MLTKPLVSAADVYRFWRQSIAALTYAFKGSASIPKLVYVICSIVAWLWLSGLGPDTALRLAISLRSYTIIELILSRTRNNPDRFQLQHTTEYLFTAVDRDDVELFGLLNEFGFLTEVQAPIKHPDYEHDLFEHAEDQNSLRILTYLKKKDARISRRDAEDRASLESAISRSNLEEIDGLLSRGCATATPPVTLRCALDRAFVMGKQAWLECLLKHDVEFFSPVVAKACQAVTARGEAEPDLGKDYQLMVEKAESINSRIEKRGAVFIMPWIHQCVTDHRICNLPEIGSTILPTRLVNISETTPFLDETAGRTGLYATLSHVWKFSASVTTTTKNIELHKRGFEAHHFSTMFNNAITVAHSLGLSYIWIDALCILQDSDQDWEIESARMASIYQNAIVNIAIEDGCHMTAEDPMHTTDTHRVKEKGTLDQRAWILQERLLAARTVTFCKQGIFWDCATLSASTLDPEGIPVRYDHAFQLREDRIYREIVRTGTLVSVNQDVLAKLSTSWKRIVEEYTSRQLARETDRLIAIQGLANTVQKISHDVYLSGLWKSQLWTDLLWKVDPKSTSWDASHSQSRLSLDVPSWTWASVRGLVSYQWPAATNHYPPSSSIEHISIQPDIDGKFRCLTIRGKVRKGINFAVRKAIEQSQRAKETPADRAQWYPDTSDSISRADMCIEIGKSVLWTWTLVISPLRQFSIGKPRYQRVGLFIWPRDRYDIAKGLKSKSIQIV